MRFFLMQIVLSFTGLSMTPKYFGLDYMKELKLSCRNPKVSAQYYLTKLVPH